MTTHICHNNNITGTQVYSLFWFSTSSSSSGGIRVGSGISDRGNGIKGLALVIRNRRQSIQKIETIVESMYIRGRRIVW
ncbi:unnamed protein product [Hymenolepis diminuta]|uniref:Uncharacterized protein n=1 Tax=Hymenolepis diminuta TaxID=6216 RepID=A0A564Y2V3_HYMDI|nr:unnamed protein product [Hymenolepis diminuta]